MAENQSKRAANKRKQEGRKAGKLPAKQGECEAEVGNKKPKAGESKAGDIPCQTGKLSSLAMLSRKPAVTPDQQA